MCRPTSRMQVRTRSLSVASKWMRRRRPACAVCGVSIVTLRGDRVDAVAAQCDLDRAGVRFECERAGRLFVELVRLEHDQDSAVRAGRAEPGARGGSVECRHMQHVPGGAAELHGPEVDRRGRRAGNEQDSRQQRGSAHTGSVLRRQYLPVRGRRSCGSPLSVGRFGPTMGDARVCTSLTADSPRRRLVARRGQVRLGDLDDARDRPRRVGVHGVWEGQARRQRRR